MKVFVTGATGVIGRRAIPLLARAGHQLSAVARTRDKAALVAQLGARPVLLDLFDRRALCREVPGHDAVINLATHIPRSTSRMLLPGAWRENDRIRREASANLVDAALASGVARFVQESFAPGYPDRGDQWVDETTQLRPARYNLSTLDAEASARRFADAGRSAVVLRFASFYGPDAFQTLAMISTVRKGWAPLPGRPDAFLSSISHDDAATAVLAALALPGSVYNVADDEPLTTTEASVRSVADIHLAYMPYSHSVATAVGAALLAWWFVERGLGRPRLARAIAIGIVSHLVLDLLTHARDIALWPGSTLPKLGLELYDRAPIWGFAVEAAYGVLCWGVYRGRWSLLAMIVLGNLTNITFFSASIPGPEKYMAGEPLTLVALVFVQIVVTLVLVLLLAARPAPHESTLRACVTGAGRADIRTTKTQLHLSGDLGFSKRQEICAGIRPDVSVGLRQTACPA